MVRPWDSPLVPLLAVPIWDYLVTHLHHLTGLQWLTDGTERSNPLQLLRTLLCSTLLILERRSDSVFESVPARFPIQFPT